jgi:benzodiazapine receptor
MKRSTQFWGLIVFLAICLAIGFAGSFATRPNIDTWYAELAKPSWTPPDSVFGPVWTALYLLMGLSAWLVWRKENAKRTIPLILFFFQLALNFAWSWIFFAAHNPGAAMVEIFLLWVAILLTIIAFWKTTCPAGILMIPYLLWVSYASALNFAIWRLNGS